MEIIYGGYESKEKARPVFLEGDGYADGNLVYDTAVCPRCGYVLDDDYDMSRHYEPYCPHCGQKIDWKAKEEEEKEE